MINCAFRLSSLLSGHFRQGVLVTYDGPMRTHGERKCSGVLHPVKIETYATCKAVVAIKLLPACCRIPPTLSLYSYLVIHTSSSMGFWPSEIFSPLMRCGV